MHFFGWDIWGHLETSTAGYSIVKEHRLPSADSVRERPMGGGPAPSTVRSALRVCAHERATDFRETTLAVSRTAKKNFFRRITIAQRAARPDVQTRNPQLT